MFNKHDFSMNRYMVNGHTIGERNGYMEEYKVVPEVITGKDLNYISDMFEWNYMAFKSSHLMMDKCQDENIKMLIGKGNEIFKKNMEMGLGILGGKDE